MHRLAVVFPVSVFATTLAAQAPTLVVSGAGAYVVPVGPVATYLAPGRGVNGSLEWRWPGRSLGIWAGASYTSFPFAAADQPYRSPRFPAPLYVSTGRTALAATAGPELLLRRSWFETSGRLGLGIAHTTTVMAGDSLGVDARYTRRKEYGDLAVLLDVTAGAGLHLSRHATLRGAVSYAALGPTQYGIEGELKVGVISGPYWHPAKQWSSYWTYQVGVALR